MIIEMFKDEENDRILLRTKGRPMFTPLQREVLCDVGQKLRASASLTPNHDIGGPGEIWLATLSHSTTEFQHTEIVSIIRDHGLDVAIK